MKRSLVPCLLALVASGACTRTQEATNAPATSATATAPPLVPSSATATAEPPPTASATASASATATASAARTTAKGTCPPAPAGYVDPSLQSNCKSDADCRAALAGRCGPTYIGHGRSVNGCTYDACATDADCKAKPGALCYCGESPTGRNACLLGNCKDDADCAGTKCSRNANGNDLGSFCRTARDACKTDGDCKSGEVCGFATTAKRWECVPRFVMPPG